MGAYPFAGMANKHTSKQQEFIVRKLAALEPHREIVRNFMAVFTDTKCDENDVRRLDPSNVVLSPELFIIFNAERERIKADPNSAPFADQKLRLIALSRDVEAYRSNNQPAEARSVMRQIAEEQGAIGQKGAAKGGAVPIDQAGGKPVAEIIRKIVDPKAPEAVAEPVG